MESTNQSFQIKKTNLILTVNTHQFPMRQLVISKSQIILFFKSFLQLWNMDQNTLISQQTLTQSLKKPLLLIKMNSTSFAFTSRGHIESKLMIWDLNTATEKVVCQNLDNFTFKSLFLCFFKEFGVISATEESGKYITLRAWKTKEKEHYQEFYTKSFENCPIFMKYNNKQTLTITYPNDTNMPFLLINVHDNTLRSCKLSTFYQNELSIQDIRQYSPNEAIISLWLKNKGRQIIIFDHSLSEIVRKTEIPIQFSKIVNLGLFWIGISCQGIGSKWPGRYRYQEFAIIRLFTEEKKSSLLIELPNAKTCYKFYPLFAKLDSSENRIKQIVEIVRVDLFARKSNCYIHLLEASGLCAAFGSQIVNKTFLNLEQDRFIKLIED